jgi:hypothetical protein
MTKIVFALLPFFILNATENPVSAQNKIATSSDSYFIMENYYKIKWGHAEEFINLWKKNHYPLLKKTKEMVTS